MNEVKKPRKRRISTDEEAQAAQSENTDRNTQVALAKVEDDNIQELLSLYPPEMRERLATSKYNVDRLIEALKDLRVDRTIPRICRGPRCHPPGSKIRTKRGDINIEDLDDSDIIASRRRDSGYIYFPMKNYSHKLVSRHFEGEMVKLSTEKAEYECTSDHTCIARWNKRALEAYVVYLMERKGTWRIGHVKLFKNKRRHTSAFNERCIKEDADRAWILDICESKYDASLLEDYYSTTFGVSQMCFIATDYSRSNWNSSLKWITQEDLDNHHKSIAKSNQDISNLLRSVSRSFCDPFWSKGKKNMFGVNCSSEISACNILSGYMQIPVDVEPRLKHRRNIKARWVDVRKSIREYNGTVYSLEVKPYETYVVDGCVTHNCPQADTCPLAAIAPAGHPCPIEQILVKKDITDYTSALEIDPMNRIEFDMVMELVEADVMDRRASADIAKNGYTQETVVAVVEQTGRPITKVEKSIALDVKAFYKRQKEKIRNSLLATRESQAKAGLSKMIDPSKFSSDLLDRAKNANAEVIEDDGPKDEPKE